MERVRLGAPPEAVKKSRLTRVHFHAEHSEVKFGESVNVVGGHPSLGEWNPEQGLRLETNEDIFPCWISVEPTIVELHLTVEYKYAVMDSNGVFRCWENYNGNRKFVASGPDMTIEDDGGLYRQKTGGDKDEEEEDEDFDARTVSMVKMNQEEKLAFVNELEGQVSLDSNDTVFLFHFDLPYKVVRTDAGGWRVLHSEYEDHLIPVLEELRKNKMIHFRVVTVGWPGVHVKNEKDQDAITKMLQEYDCIPVFPPESEMEQFRYFCDNFLWPIFHDVMLFFQSSNPPPFNETQWAAYQHINNIYANAVVSHAHESDLIWIHDYQLLMMPTFISRKLARANIGFYLHTPFPSSDSFKSLPIREELLSGMLCADQLGFQFFASARNFLVSCKRIYGLDPVFKAGGFMGVDYNGRTIMIKVAHFGLPFKDMTSAALTSKLDKKAHEVRALFPGKTIFVGADRCDGLSGLTLKFRDFKRWLGDHPERHGKVVLIQYASSADRDEFSLRLKESLREEADAEIILDENGAMKLQQKQGAQGEAHIYIRYDYFDREDRLALFRAADVLLDTSVKAGLNLMPFEFITVHHDDAEKKCSSIAIVSEFSGCSRVLLGCLRTNPWNSSEVAAALQKSLTMAEKEKLERYEMDYTYTMDYSVTQWFEDFLTDLRRARKKESIRIESIGFGARTRPIAVNAGFQRLPIEHVLNAMWRSKRRVFLFDNEGTLAADRRHVQRTYGAPKGTYTQLSSSGSAPDESVLKCLRTLTEDSTTMNTVMILSGRSSKQLEEWFSSVPKIGLAAERGFYYKLPILTGNNWHCTAQDTADDWKSYAFELMRQFVKRTQGAYIENKGSALVWQYRDADQHYGSWQAKELSSHLKELLFGFDVEVVEGKGYVEVKLRKINKGVAVGKVLSKVAKVIGEVDFVLCIGDDRSDEDMFEVVNAIGDASGDQVVNPMDTTSQLSTTDGSDDYSDGQDPKPMSRLASKESKRAYSKGQGLLRGSPTNKSMPMRSPESGGTFAGFGRTRSAIGMGSGAMGGLGASNFSMGSSVGFDLSSLGACDDELGSRRFFTCTVGRKPSAAKFFLHDVEEVTDLLTTIAAQSKRKSSIPRSSSMAAVDSSLTWSTGDRRGGMSSLANVSFGADTSPLKSKSMGGALGSGSANLSSFAK